MSRWRQFWRTIVICTLPRFPSLVAMILTVPAPVAVTIPVEETCAALVLLDDHVTSRPGSTPFAASRTDAVANSLCPTRRNAAGVVTTMLLILTAVTVNGALADLPSLVPAMLAVPVETAVTSPSAETVVTAGLLELHVTRRPVSTPFVASRSDAVAVAVCPGLSVAVFSATRTSATASRAALTVTEALELMPSLVACIIALPGLTAVTMPVVLTAATAELLELQLIVRPVNGAPVASRSAAEAASVWPTVRTLVASATPIVATGVGTTGCGTGAGVGAGAGEGASDSPERDQTAKSRAIQTSSHGHPLNVTFGRIIT